MTPSDVMAISKHLPVLYFYNFEDHGWGFTLHHQGEAVSAFDLSYEQEEVDLMNYVQGKFPDQNAVELLYISPDFFGICSRRRPSHNLSGSTPWWMTSKQSLVSKR
ncbi:hypothetical protein P5G65_25480 [Paenibacillus chondroitinus]|uniref:Uncharacterized protein n=1 Tax=Paenibacillus chondroitinus TaxID=59842 RepID=A0ABU6DHN0_9BACL|nr:MULTISPECIES: hypothetical protein [Paenibacillus]MCY9662733.1 hypothetical protein [Paenibacillus anseongense]MEB4797260.1 hypothetical protein [Paenibacillus chondroitinus]